MDNSFYTNNELKKLKFKKIGENVLISKKASIYSANHISIGDNVRIDDFCILSGNISLGSYIHIAAYCALYASKNIILKDFSGLSANVIIYSAIDDFSGVNLIGPMIANEYRNITGGPVVLNKFVQIGAGSILFPDISIGEGAVVGAMSLVKENIKGWTINAGIPTKILCNRKQNIVNIEKEFVKKLKESL